MKWLLRKIGGADVRCSDVLAKLQDEGRANAKDDLEARKKAAKAKAMAAMAQKANAFMAQNGMDFGDDSDLV